MPIEVVLRYIAVMRLPAARTFASVLTIFVATAIASPRAEARAQRDVDYRYEEVWNALVRLLRVDYRFAIDERDDANGFLLFRYVEYGRTHTASVEVVRVGEAETARVRTIVQVEGVPTHDETRILDDLERKLRTELGRRTRAPVVADRADGGTPRTIPRLREEPEEGESEDEPATGAPNTEAREAPPESAPAETPRRRRR